MFFKHPTKPLRKGNLSTKYLFGVSTGACPKPLTAFCSSKVLLHGLTVVINQTFLFILAIHSPSVPKSQSKLILCHVLLIPTTFV